MITIEIGYIRNFRKPTYMAKLTAIICSYHALEVIYLRPRDVNINKNTVTGKKFINNKWVSVEADLPPFIDISPYCFKAKNSEVIKHLRKNSFLSDNRTNKLTKEKLQAKLKEDERFSHLVIPTIKVRSIDDLWSFFKKYPIIVMKPISGERGRGIYVLEKKNGDYIVGHQKKEIKFSQEELIPFFEEIIKERRYILQKHITSRSLQGDPFDCRVHVEKNGKGEWVSAKKFIRIGIGQKVISNVNQGGGINDPEPFLKANFEHNWESIIQELDELAVTLPYKIERLRKTKIMSLGLDVGIDKNGKLYLFEVNGAPTTAPLKSEVALLRADYYKYVLKHVLERDLRNNKRDIAKLKRDFDKVKKEREIYKLKYQAIKNSRVWRATGPVRTIGKLVRRIGKQ